MDYNEVLRYLGYNNQVIDEDLDKVIYDCMEEIQRISKPKHHYEIFDISIGQTVQFHNTTLALEAADIKKHLRHSDKAAVMAVTLGIEVDRKIRYFERTDLTRSVILDACATSYIEEICDRVCDELKQKAALENKYTTLRFSPGYGDLDIACQRDIIDVLQAEKKTGITCAEGFIMIPRKSVTAIVGFADTVQTQYTNKCDTCNLRENCPFQNKKACRKR